MREYRIGEIIRKRRIELGLTQGELCEGIYEEPTMSRIENGKQTPSRTKLSVLLQRLGLPDDRYYALLSDNETKIADLQKEIVSCNVLKDSIRGLEKISELEEVEEEDDTVIHQFILRSKVILGKMEDGKVKDYSFEEKLKLLFEAICLTSPKFNLEEIDKGLYGLDEAKIINQIAGVYSDFGDNKKAIDIYYQLLKYIKKHFQNVLQSGGLLPLVSYNYARELNLTERYKESIDIATTGWMSCVQYGQYRYLPGVLAIISDSYYHLNNHKMCKEYLLQAYYIYKGIADFTNASIMEENANDWGIKLD